SAINREAPIRRSDFLPERWGGFRGDRWQGRECVSEHSASRIDMCAEELISVQPGAGYASGLEQGGELLDVGLGVVVVAVVEQHVGLFGVAGQGTHLGRPFGQLSLGVAVAEPLVDVAAVPLG